MRSIWGYYHWLEEVIKQALITSKRDFSGSYKGGKGIYFRRLGERYLLICHSSYSNICYWFFQTPYRLCHEIEAMVLKFWQVQCGDRGKIHCICWEELTKSKMARGMDFKDFIYFNDALLAKQTWWLFNNVDSLFYKFFKAIFFLHYSILEAKESILGSYAWKSILEVETLS